jgi:hypothetical protein
MKKKKINKILTWYVLFPLYLMAFVGVLPIIIIKELGDWIQSFREQHRENPYEEDSE